MTRPLTPSGSIVVRILQALAETVAYLLPWIVFVVIVLALFALSGCEGEPPHCPPPIGCAR